MTEKEVVWVVCNTNSAKEADRLGKAILKKRLCACYAVYPRIKSVYYWPPKSKKLEISRGPLLVLETLEKNYGKISELIKQLHSDKVPFIGKFEINGVNENFYNWLKGEIK